MYVLGLNAFHADASACLLRDGRIVAAVEEERFGRIKHWAGFPAESIRHCLAEAGITVAELDAVAVNQDTRASFWRRLAYTLRHRPDPGAVLRRLGARRQRMDLGAHFDRAFGAGSLRVNVMAVEHHLCHLASAYYGSRHARAAAVSIDGFGDFASGAWGLGEGSRISVDDRIHFPHSLGILYQAITQYLGFPHYGDEYKVMGLAPYGTPSLLPQLRKLVSLEAGGRYRLSLAYFRHPTESVDLTGPDGKPDFAPLYTESLVELMGPARDPQDELTQRHRDIAHSLQVLFEEALFHVLRHVHARYGGDALVLAGGCAMNSVANGKIRAHTPFQKLYVQPAAGDSGGALGAAQVAWTRIATGASRPEPMDHAQWGPAYDDDTIAATLSGRSQEIAGANCRVERIADRTQLCRHAAQAIADGNVVGWFQGRMEWGPRALGNRSILCDPRRGDMKALLNAKIKRRESFRPFAPSILRADVADWFEQDDDVPFMTQVLPIRADKRALIPAVTHVDGTGRLQTVTREGNPLYHELIAAFRALTGVPMVLNTSFNESEPIVRTPDQALDCFLRTNMDRLYLGTHVVSRSTPAAGA